MTPAQLKAQRKKLGYTGVQMAAAMNISPNNYYRIENASELNERQAENVAIRVERVLMRKTLERIKAESFEEMIKKWAAEALGELE